MAIKKPVSEVQVGDIILDGIASKVLTALPREIEGTVFLILLDGNGYTETVVWSENSTVLWYDDWTDEDWEGYLAM
ncbi:hypothetical protein SEA_CECE_330 [Microbacterium phage Cece]|nr:hypothetical protein SEA_CECE_28 [Microbacterium phage Cece]UVG35336.1 hypothetical protein SEA_CECE_330 [Microbacterium phage Cece]